MNELQTKETRLDEFHRCQDRSWLSPEDEKRFGVSNPMSSVDGREGLIHIGQKVSILGEQSIGMITKLLLNSTGRLSHLAVRAARHLGGHRTVPISAVRDVTASRVLLAIDKDQFKELPEYRSDGYIAEEVDRELRKDSILRISDYNEIDVRVNDGVITLNGHVITSMNQWRAESAVDHIPGALEVKSYLISDDKLTLKIAGALGELEQSAGCKFFTRVENGLAVLGGAVNRPELREEAEKRVSEIPEVRGIFNEIRVCGEEKEPPERRFLQPVIGAELYFKDGVSVTIRKVVINPHNRLVTAVVVMGQVQDWPQNNQFPDPREERIPERLMIIPVDLLLILTPSSGFIQVNSDETSKFARYEPSFYLSPDKNWLPPYPYCNSEVLLPVE